MKPPEATDYAAHLALVFDRVRAHCSRLLTREERRLVDAALALPAQPQRLLAQLAGRKRRVFPQRSLPPGDCSPLLQAGWLERCRPAEDPDGVVESLSREDLGEARNKTEAAAALAELPDFAAHIETEHGPFLRFSQAGRDCLQKTRLLGFGDWREDLSDLVRLGLGQLRPPAGTPLAWSLDGRSLQLDPFPLASAGATSALLAARALAELPCERELLPQVMAALDAARGQALPLLGHRFGLVHPLADWLWRCLDEQALDDEEQAAIIALLGELPLSPAMSRRLGRERWRRAVGRGRRTVAEELAGWAIWSGGEQRRWGLRASGKRAGPRAESIWPVQRLRAWLDHDASGTVIAEGEGVEAHALRRLAADGWQGLHCEGQLWMALAMVIGWPLLSAPVPGVWWSPLQSLPGDWGEWGFAERRRPAFAALRASILADPLAALDAGWRALGLERVDAGDAVQLLGPGPLPPLRLLRAVCERLPARGLAALVIRLLKRPQERSGLPDLLVWRDEGLQLWEVKSPGDSLSDQQWSWLEWLRLEDIPAGVLRIDAEPSRQLSLLDGPAAPLRSTASVHRRARSVEAPRPARPARGGGLQALLLPGDRLLALGLRRQLPDLALTLPEQACWGFDDLLALEHGPDPGNRPLLRCLPLRGFCWLEDRRRRWQLLPPGLHLALAERLEADPEGGLQPCAHLLLRPAGWCCEADAQAEEPLLLDREQAAAYRDLACGDILDHLHRPPSCDPCRVDDCAAAWGLREALGQQLALLAHEPHAVEADPVERRLLIHLDPRSAVLWLGLPGLERRDAGFL